MKKIIIIFLFVPFFTIGQNPYSVKAKSKVNSKETNLNSEQLFLKNNFPFVHITDWYSGMKFMVSEADKYSFRLRGLKKYKGSDAQLQHKDYEFEIFEVKEVEERIVRCPKGKCVRTYVILENNNKKYEKELIGSKEDLKKEQRSSHSISNFIYLSDIDKAKELLLDSTLYVLSDHWMTEDGPAYKEKFVPVKITKIGLGNSSKPVKIVFTAEGYENEYFKNLTFSGTNAFKVSSFPEFTTSFEDFFSFSNPKEKYNIKNDIWDLIKKGNVKIGMTEKECELSWGKPNDINKTILEFGSEEQWVYSNSYLYFENGKLKGIQN